MSDEEDPNANITSPKHSSSTARGYSARVSTWQAPLPPPNLLREYNEAFPGCAERIVAMAEAESKERHEENRHERDSFRLIVAGDIYSQKVGLWLAFVLAISVISVGAFLIYTGRLAWGTSLIGIPLIALVSLFIYGRKQQGEELGKLDPSDDDNSDQPSLPFP